MQSVNLKMIIILAAVIAVFAFSGCSSKANDYNNKGLKYYENGDYDSAINSFDKAIEQNGKEASYYINKSYVFMAKGDYAAASDCINSAVTLDSESKNILRAQGILYFRTADYMNAIEYFNKCLDKIGNHVTEFDYDVLMYKAEAEYNAGLAAEAVKTYSILIETQDENKEFYYWRAMSYLQTGEEESALDDFKNYISRIGTYEAYIQVYQDLKNAGYSDSASQVIDKALSLSDKTSADLKYRGIIYYILGDYNKSITEHQKIDEKDKNSEICIYEGMAFEALGDLANTSDFYEKAVEKGGSSPELFYEIAVCNMTLEHYDDAIYYISRGIEINDEKSLESLMYLQIVCNEKAHNYSAAIEAVNAYIDKFGTSDDLEHELAFLKTRTE